MSMTAVPSRSARLAKTQDAAAQNSKPLFLPDEVIESAAPAQASPVVNVFGEFTPSRRSLAMTVSDPTLQQQTFPQDGQDGDVCISPDGKWMVFATSSASNRTHLIRQTIGDSARIKLTRSAGDDAQPAISPDGQSVAFCSNRSGTWHLYGMNADGRQVSQLTDGEGNEMHPNFSPDGKRLVYSSLDEAGEWSICILDLASRQSQTIGKGLFPVWSPQKDADVIAFQKTRARGSRWFSLWTCTLVTNDSGQAEAVDVSEIAASNNAALIGPAWSPDGQHLAFSSIVDPAQMRSGKPQGQQDVWIIDAGSGLHKRRITDGAGTNLAPCWASDNRVYFVSDRSGHEAIWSLPVLESQRSQASQGESAASDPSEIRP